MITGDRPPAVGSADVLAWLTRALQAGSKPAPKLVINHTQENPSSTHWVIGEATGNGQPRFFVKQHASQLLYVQEREALALLADYASRDEPFCVPRVVAVSDRMNCIAMDWIEGESIAATIRSSVGRFATLAEFSSGVQLSYRIGEWLWYLKDRTFRPATRFPHVRMRARFLELLQIIDSAKPDWITDATRSRMIATFEQCLNDAQPDADCLVHHDFWFDHIWTRRNQIIVLDFGRAQMGPAGRDAVQFHNRLADLALFNPLVSKKACTELVNTFQRGYGSPVLSTPVDLVWQMLTRIEQLAGLVEAHAGGSVLQTLRIRSLMAGFRRMFD